MNGPAGRPRGSPSYLPQPLFKLIEPALVFSVNVAWGAVPTSPFAVAPVVEWFTVTVKLVLIEPTSVVAFKWKLGVPVSVISIDPALVSKSYVPVEPMVPVKLMLPAFVLNVESPVSEDCVAPMVPALLTNDIFPLTPFMFILPALKIPTPVTSLPSEIGQTIDNIPSARSAKFLRTCSQMIFSTPSSFLFGPTFKITTQYFLVVASICCINSSLIVII